MRVPSPFRVPTWPTWPVEWVRGRLALEVAHLLIGDNPPVRERRGPVETDPGLFGPDSVTWRLHNDSCMIVGGLRALMLQTMHPLAMAGVADHSNFREDPLGRLANTATYVGTVIFGTTEQADQAITMVKRVHERVVGTAPDGRPYEANDPHLLTWVHHTLVDSFLRAYQRYGAGPLSAADADRYVEEWSVLADRFGAEPAARSVAELKGYFRDMRPELGAGSQARDTIRFLLAPPLPLAARPAYAIIAAGAVGMLPRWIRWDLRLPLPPVVEPLVVRPATWTLFRTVDWVMAGYPYSEDALATFAA